MKLSELRPCDYCGGVIAPHFYVLRITQALIGGNAAREVAGLAMYFGGFQAPGAFALAEAFAPRPDDAVLVFGEKDPSLFTEIFLCDDCMPTAVHGAMERRNARQDDVQTADAEGTPEEEAGRDPDLGAEEQGGGDGSGRQP